VSVFDTNAYVETPAGDDAAIAIAGRRSYVDLAVDAAVPDTAAVTFEIPPRYYDMQILGTWRPARAHRLEAFFFGSDDHVKVATESRTDLGPSIPLGDFESRSIFYRGLLRHEYAPSVGVHNELELSVGWDRANTIRPAQFDQDLRQTTIQAREKLRFALAPTLSLDLGVDWLEVRASGHLRSQGAILRKEGDAFYDQSSSETVQTEIGGAWAHYPATYVGAEWQPLAGLEVLPSLRLDYFGGAEQLTLDPRGTIRYGVTPTVTAKAAVGIYHQEPTIDELDEAWGNPTLEAERAIHYSLGAEVRPTGRLSIDVTAFYKQMDHMVARSSAVVERGGGLVPERYTNGGEGRVIGVDVFVRQQLSHNLFGWVAYTLSRAERRDPGASAWRRFDRDQTHILAAVASYRLPHNWELGARWRYVTGSPYTPIEGGVFDADSDVYRPLTGSINAGRIDAFHQLDVRLDKRWIYDGWMLDAYVELQNAYDRRNAEGYEYSFDYSQKEAASFVGITPMVGLRAEL
jgi:outer membrane receptor protein involved in Fe transport